MLQIAMLGAIVGTALGLTGAGGGIVAIPLLTFGLGLAYREAASIALISVGLAAAVGAVLGLLDGTVRYRAALVIGVGGAVVAPLGIALASRTPSSLLSAMLATVMLLSAVTTYRRSKPVPVAAQVRPEPPCRCDPSTGRLIWTPGCAGTMAGIGATTGLLSGLLGVGGGFLLVPALTRFTDVSVRGIVATSQAVIAIVSLSGAVAAARYGHLDPSVALPFVASAVLALAIARSLGSRLPGPVVLRCFSWLSGTVAIAVASQALWTVAQSR